MVVTITKSGVTFTFSEGEINTISTNTSAMLDYDAMPMSTADNAMLFDFNGVTKTISVSGQLFDDGSNHLSSGSAVTRDEQRQWLEKILDGNQTQLLFDSNHSSTWNGSSFGQSTCCIGSVNFTENSGDPNRLYFEIQLQVGNV